MHGQFWHTSGLSQQAPKCEIRDRWTSYMNFYIARLGTDELEPDPCSLEIYRMCKYELPTSTLLKVIVWQRDRQTRPKLYTMPLCTWSIKVIVRIQSPELDNFHSLMLLPCPKIHLWQNLHEDEISYFQRMKQLVEKCFNLQRWRILKKFLYEDPTDKQTDRQTDKWWAKRNQLITVTWDDDSHVTRHTLQRRRRRRRIYLSSLQQ